MTDYSKSSFNLFDDANAQHHTLEITFISPGCVYNSWEQQKCYEHVSP